MTLIDKLHALGTVFDIVGELEYVDVIAKTTMAYEASGYKDTEQVRDCEREIDLASAHTATILGQAKAGTTLLDVVSTYWRDLPVLWGHKRTRLDAVWTPVLVMLARVFSVTTATAEFVVVQEEPAAPEFVAALHYLSEKEPALRLMFMEAQDPDVVYVGVVTNEPALNAMLAPYPSANWRGNEVLSSEDDGGHVVTEFWVYTIGGTRVFRTHGYLAACDKGALEVLKTGAFLPVVATTKTASVIRLTFSMQAMTDPHFRDFLRDLGGMPVSKVSWDIPIHESADINNTLRKVENGFAYPVQMHQIVDSPDQNIYAHTNPDAQVVRVLSGTRIQTRTGVVSSPSMTDIREYVTKLLPETNGAQRHALEHVLGACATTAHFVVTCDGELEQGSIPDMFAARTESDPVRVVLVVGGTYPALVTENALCDD